MNKYDEWRAKYDQMSYLDQMTYAISFIDNGKDQSETRHQLMSKELTEFFSNTQNRIHWIYEFGGWQGYLAKEILSQFKHIHKWINQDFAIHAIDRTKCNDPRYCAFIQSKPFWQDSNVLESNIGSDELSEIDTFIACHCLEHIKWSELQLMYKIIKNSDIEFIFIDIPIPDDKPDWTNYEGTHILDVGYNEVIKLFSQDYNLIKRNGSFTSWGRKE
jgi:hypothetical protein